MPDSVADGRSAGQQLSPGGHPWGRSALARGAELTTVRDNLRHASISPTSIYLHGDEVRRARQMGDAFATRPS